VVPKRKARIAKDGGGEESDMKSRNISSNNRVEVSRLRGIKILYEDDLYELANIVLKIMDAIDNLSGGVISRPTINGLVKQYSFLCSDQIHPEQVVDIIAKHGLDIGDIIECDSKVNKSV
jgi:hypothetical protein